MDEISIFDKIKARNAVVLTRENIRAIIEDYGTDPYEDTSLFQDIKDYMECSAYYLSNWSDYALDFNSDGFLELKLFYLEQHCATLVFKKVLGTYVEDVDWVKEGF